MYNKIMVPVDLAKLGSLEKALATAGDLAKHYSVPVVYVGITTETPSEVAHNPSEFEAKMNAFATSQGSARGIETSVMAMATHDPTVDLDQHLLEAVDKTGADLVVMGSHQPGILEHMFASNAGYVAMHAKVTVMVIR